MNRDSHIIQIELEKIVPNRFQPRKTFNDDITELAESIRQHGVLQPITVRPLGEKFEIVMGERRYRACEKLGIRKIPCIVVQMDDNETMEVALIENLQRQDLTPIEEALSYKRILEMGNVTQEQLAQRIGKTQSTIANKLRLLSLDKEVQKALLNGEISERHARTLLQLDDEEAQRQLLKKIVNDKLTVKKTEEEVRRVEREMRDSKNESESVEIMDFALNSPSQVPEDNIIDVDHSLEQIPEDKLEVDNKSDYNNNDSWQFLQNGIDDDFDFENVNKPKQRNNIPTLDIVDDMNEHNNLNTIESNHSFDNNYMEENISLTNIEPDSIVMDDELALNEDSVSSEKTQEVLPDFNTFDELKPIVEKFQNEIKALGYKIDLEKNDFETMYQFIFNVYKKNQ